MSQCENEPICVALPLRRVGYAYVPIQQIGKVYPPSTALAQGTVFPELNIGIEEYERGIWNGK